MIPHSIMFIINNFSYGFTFSRIFGPWAKAVEPRLLTGTSFLSFRMGTLGGIVDCLSAGLSLSPLCGEFSPLPTTTETQLKVWHRNLRASECVCKGQREKECMWICSCVFEEKSEWKNRNRHVQRTLSHTYSWFQWVQSICRTWTHRRVILKQQQTNYREQRGREGGSRLAGRIQRIKYSHEQRKVLMHYTQPAL